jgi:membrane-bound ClpP family serine protease
LTLGIIIFLALFGFALIALDIFFLPGGLVAFFGLAIIAYADYSAYVTLGKTGGHIFTLASVLISAVFIYLMFKPGFWKKMSQTGEITGKANTEDISACREGDTGIALSQLRPSGSARINGQIVEVHSRDSIIDAGTEIQVIKIDHHRIFVQPINS